MDSTQNRDATSARGEPSAAGGVHIHIERDRVILDGEVASKDVHRSILEACRRAYADRRLIDQLLIHQDG